MLYYRRDPDALFKMSDRLHEILHLLWENGPLYDDKIGKAVEELIEDLKP